MGWRGEKLGEDNRDVVASDKVALGAAERDKREFRVESVRLVDAQACEEKLQEFLFFEARREVLDSSIIEK